MPWLVTAMAVLILGGVLAWLIRSSSGWRYWLGPGSAIVGCLIGLTALVRLGMGATEEWRLAWHVPYGSFHVGVDPLSSFFLLPLFFLSALAAGYGSRYLKEYHGQLRLGAHWFFFNLFIASMVLVIVARDGALFLIAWESMSLASYFLVTFNHEDAKIQSAGWIYLVATQVGMAFLLVLFLCLGQGVPSLDFDLILAAGTPGVAVGGLFGLALLGFGTKAGIMPLHVWLPEAHPAAPSHVSALMSGMMIKLGIYGLLRTWTFLHDLPIGCAFALIGIGLTSGVLGVVLALAQHELKRLLAYHSVENIGIIVLGLGTGLLGIAVHSPALAVLGLAGGLLHVINHAVFKSLLFFGAGAVIHSTGTGDIERLGGLHKRMRVTSLTFLIGAAAICGLPPLNGFISEFLIYLGTLQGGVWSSPRIAVALFGVLAGLALIGGLAVACFTKAFGIIFLGEPRSTAAIKAREIGWGMRIPMLVLAASCVFIGVLAPWVFKALQPVLNQLLPFPAEAIHIELQNAGHALQGIVLVMLAGLVFLTLILGIRRYLLSGRVSAQSLTWDCGYAKPSPRMQYTASSFAWPLTRLFALFLQIKKTEIPVKGLFPKTGSLHTETPDVFREWLLAPVFRGIARGFSQLRWLQHGRVQLYVLYIALALLGLLLWKLRA